MFLWRFKALIVRTKVAAKRIYNTAFSRHSTQHLQTILFDWLEDNTTRKRLQGSTCHRGSQNSKQNTYFRAQQASDWSKKSEISILELTLDENMHLVDFLSIYIDNYCLCNWIFSKHKHMNVCFLHSALGQICCADTFPGKITSWSRRQQIDSWKKRKIWCCFSCR